MSEILMYNLCAICLTPIRWHQGWIGTKRYENLRLGIPGPWVERAHYKCWRKAQEDAKSPKPDFTIREPDNNR